MPTRPISSPHGMCRLSLSLSPPSDESPSIDGGYLIVPSSPPLCHDCSRHAPRPLTHYYGQGQRRTSLRDVTNRFHGECLPQPGEEPFRQTAHGTMRLSFSRYLVDPVDPGYYEIQIESKVGSLLDINYSAMSLPLRCWTSSTAV